MCSCLSHLHRAGCWHCSIPSQPCLLLGCTAPSTGALVLWVFYEFPWPSELCHEGRPRCAPLAGCPKGSSVLFRMSGTNTSVQAAVGLQVELATLNVYMKNLRSLGMIQVFLPLLRLPQGCFSVRQFRYKFPIFRFWPSVTSASHLPPCCVHVQSANLPILGTSGL